MTDNPRFSVEVEYHDRVSILPLHGRLDGTTVGLLTKTCNDSLAAGQTALLFDCEDLRYISSAGLRTLLIAVRKTLCCALAAHIAEIFAVTGFTDILDIRASRAEALASL